MKLFFKEHALLLVVQAIQILTVLTIFWLDGYRNIPLFFYAAFLTFFILGSYLIYYYLARQKLYQRLNQPIESLDDSLIKTDDAPISSAFD